MQTGSTNSKNLRKDGKDLTMENYLVVTPTINYNVRKINLKKKKISFKKELLFCIYNFESLQ